MDDSHYSFSLLQRMTLDQWIEDLKKRGREKPHCGSLMEQILVNFLQEVNLKGVKAWDITLRNIKIIHHMYGVTNAQ